MRDLKKITENEMILAFVRGEADAHRWAAHYRAAGLVAEDFSRKADLDDDGQNERRRSALAHVRGYGRNEWLFRGLPSNVTWYRGNVTVGELANFQHLNYPAFIQLTEGSRLVGDGCRNAQLLRVEEGLGERILDLAKAVSGGARFAPLIVVSPEVVASPVILEGNTRASAYVRELDPDAEIEVILGVSPAMDAMAFF